MGKEPSRDSQVFFSKVTLRMFVDQEKPHNRAPNNFPLYLLMFPLSISPTKLLFLKRN